jgi:endonuclease YncB( thermonuclease family)
MRFRRGASGSGPGRFGAAAAVMLLLSGGVPAPGEDTTAAPAPAAPPPSAPAYWQAPPLPQAVIQGGAIPLGWQPQAVPYQGVGPDGKPLTMYFAPTYTFTYQAGPPVPAVPQVNRRRRWGGQPSPTMAAPAATGWNYATSGAPPVTTTLPPGGVTQYRSAYRFPPDARALQGTELTPPGPLPAPPPLPTEAWSGAAAAAPPPTAPPPPPFVTSPTPLAPPPSQWVPVQPQPVASVATPAAIGSGAGLAAGAAYPPPPASPPPLPLAAPPAAPVAAPPPSIPIQPLSPPPAKPVSRYLWRVVGVYDGDSVTCLDETGQQHKVNLAGIEAPGISQEHGRASREALAGLVFGRVVEVVDEGRDGSGTLVARLFVDGSDVNRQMVATGNAWSAAAANDPGLATAQAEAQAQRLGLWAQATGDPR